MLKIFSGRPVIRPFWLLLAAALYIGVFLNYYFYHQVWMLIPVTNLKSALFFFSMPLVSTSAIFILLNLAAMLYIARPLAALLIILASSAHYFMSVYGVVIDRSMIVNIVNTTPAESYALLTPRMIGWFLLTAVLPIALLFWPRLSRKGALWKRGAMRLLALVVSVVLILLVAQVWYKDYASLFRNNKELIKSLSPSNSIAASLSWYQHYRQSSLPLVPYGTDAQQRPQMKNGKPNLTILVLGETTRADDYGLESVRQTTPLLAQDQVIYYPQTQSCGTSTGVSVPCMFSGMKRTDYNDELASHREGLMDMLQRAGIRVLWRENDGGCKGACTRVPTEDMNALNLPGMCIDGECYDEVLFHKLDDYINQLHGDGVIVLHTIGSHGPTYSHRYPAQFRRFTPTCDTNEVQTCSREQLQNTYDNTILYSDYIVDKAIALLKARQSRFTTSLVYLSDHGESLGENGVYLHGLPYAIAPAQQTHVPMLLWLSPDYQQRYGVSAACLKRQASQQHVSQDNLFPTMLGLFGITSHVYQPQLDLLQACRRAG